MMAPRSKSENNLHKAHMVTPFSQMDTELYDLDTKLGHELHLLRSSHKVHCLTSDLHCHAEVIDNKLL